MVNCLGREGRGLRKLKERWSKRRGGTHTSAAAPTLDSPLAKLALALDSSLAGQDWAVMPGEAVLTGEDG